MDSTPILPEKDGEHMREKPVAAGKSSFDLIDVEKMFSQLAVEPGSTFLDLACGNGRYSLPIAEKIGPTGKVYAADLWQEGLDLLTDEAKAKGLENIETIFTDITSPLPLEANSVDVALLATILHDLSPENRDETLKECARLVKPGGVLHIIEFKKIATGPGPGIAIRLDKAEVDASVIPCGFARVDGGAIGEYNYMLSYRRRPEA